MKTILGICCNAYMLSNAINSASCAIPIDVEVIITIIYMYFNHFTIRVTSLKQFREEANIEYKNNI